MKRLIRLVLLLPLLLLVQVTAAPAPVAAQKNVTAVRLFVADAQTGTVSVLDAVEGRVIASFSTPSTNPGVVASPGGRWVYVINTAANKVTIIDTGMRREDHGDHQDLVLGPAFVRGTVTTGRRPIDTWAQHGMATVHNDDDGTLAVFDEDRLETELTYTEIRGAGTGHNNAVVLDGVVLLSLAAKGEVTAYRMNGTAIQTFEGCMGTHGWATRGANMAAAGCADGVMIFTRMANGVQARKIGEPAGSPETARVGTIVAHENAPFFVGNFGQGLAIIRPDADVLQPVPLPSAPVRFWFDVTGTRIVVLTRDGVVRLLDAASGTQLGQVPAVTAMQTGEGAPPTAQMALAGEMAYVTDPQAGTLVEVDLARMSVTRRLALGGAPRGIAAVRMTGVMD